MNADNAPNSTIWINTTTKQRFQKIEGKWEKVSDRLPEEGVYVLTYWKNHDEYRLDYIIHDEKDKFWACVLDDDGNIVTHWMELPKPPED